MDIISLIDPKELLEFSQNFSISRNYLGDTIFPDTKTKNLKAEFYRLTDSRNIPTMAMVHAFDTEAHIGQRPTAEKVKLEKMLIKEKINQSERVQMFLENGADESAIVQYIFDDVARLSESVKTRTEVMKCELLQTGKVTVKENGVNMTIDYGVPSTNKSSLDVSTVGKDVLGQLQTFVDSAKDAGETIKSVVTSSKVIRKLRQNTGIQTAIYGTVGAGTFVSNQALNQFMQNEYGFTITTYDEQYRYEKANGQLAQSRYIAEDKFIGLSTLPNNSMGNGLWGVTPEEAAAAPWNSKSMNQFITAAMWTEADPVAVWTKASGLFVPVMPNPKGLFIASVSF